MPAFVDQAEQLCCCRLFRNFRPQFRGAEVQSGAIFNKGKKLSESSNHQKANSRLGPGPCRLKAAWRLVGRPRGWGGGGEKQKKSPAMFFFLLFFCPPSPFPPPHALPSPPGSRIQASRPGDLWASGFSSARLDTSVPLQ